MATSATQTPQKKSQIRQEAGVCRRSRKDESLRETSEFSEFIDQSELRLVAQKLEDFLNTLYSEPKITR